MFVLKSVHQREMAQLTESSGKYKIIADAVTQHCAFATLSPDGQVIDTNTAFASIFGKQPAELSSHQDLCFASDVSKAEFNRFWHQVTSGHPTAGKYRRQHKDGHEIWIKGTYSPLYDTLGKMTGVLHIAQDITEEYKDAIAGKALSKALSKSTAVIEFSPQGDVLTANDNFLSTMGYSLEQIKGQPHRLFCYDAFYEENPGFWRDLGSGQFKSGLFRRKASNGQAVWLEATYNPIFAVDGSVEKVIKFATDVTNQVEEKQNISQASEHAVSISEETSQIALRGTETLRKSVEMFENTLREVEHADELIKQLNIQSANIENIVSTIRSIAEQTNLLALNAAIEAARAGDQGRGFAVVADEVRELAKRTSESTVEIESVVEENKQLAISASEKMSLVKRNVDENAEQIGSVQSVISEIHQGAVSVTENVSRILHP